MIQPPDPPAEPTSGSGAVTELLLSWRGGDSEAPKRLFPLVYEELRRMAHLQLGRRHGETLNTTALVHEAYLKLADHSRLELNDRHHFLSLAARAMRQLVVDHARRRAAQKRGGALASTMLDEERLALDDRSAEILALDDALEQLAVCDQRLARVVELRFFAGLPVEEVADVLATSPRTVRRDWRKARAFLYHQLAAETTG